MLLENTVLTGLGTMRDADEPRRRAGSSRGLGPPARRRRPAGSTSAARRLD
jgi:hypothetical protein